MTVEEWDKKYEEYVKPLFKHLDRPNGVLANYFIECIRSLNHLKKEVTFENLIEELKLKPVDLSLLDYPEYHFMFENAFNYYIEWESLSYEEKDKIKKARQRRYITRVGQA